MVVIIPLKYVSPDKYTANTMPTCNVNTSGLAKICKQAGLIGPHPQVVSDRGISMVDSSTFCKGLC